MRELQHMMSLSSYFAPIPMLYFRRSSTGFPTPLGQDDGGNGYGVKSVAYDHKSKHTDSKLTEIHGFLAEYYVRCLNSTDCRCDSFSTVPGCMLYTMYILWWIPLQWIVKGRESTMLW